MLLPALYGSFADGPLPSVSASGTAFIKYDTVDVRCATASPYAYLYLRPAVAARVAWAGLPGGADMPVVWDTGPANLTPAAIGGIAVAISLGLGGVVVAAVALLARARGRGTGLGALCGLNGGDRGTALLVAAKGGGASPRVGGENGSAGAGPSASMAGLYDSGKRGTAATQWAGGGGAGDAPPDSAACAQAQASLDRLIKDAINARARSTTADILGPGAAGAGPRRALAEWEIDLAAVAVLRRPDGRDWVLGEGSSGRVYRGLLNGVQDVAIKGEKVVTVGVQRADPGPATGGGGGGSRCGQTTGVPPLGPHHHRHHHDPLNVVFLDQDAGGDSEAAARLHATLQREVAILRSLRDKNVVAFVGASVRPGATVLCTELCSRGDLFRALRADGGRTLSASVSGDGPSGDQAPSAVCSARANPDHGRGPPLSDDQSSSRPTAGTGGAPSYRFSWAPAYVSAGGVVRRRPGTGVNWNVALDVARGLHYLHSRGILHLDLKSANILLASDGSAKLADVGLAKIVKADGALSTVGNVGTFAWAAPEILMGRKASEKSDIFSFGVVLHELSTGATPTSRFMRPLAVPAEAPPAVAAMIERCLDDVPDKRPSALELAAFFEAGLAACDTEAGARAPGAAASSGPLEGVIKRAGMHSRLKGYLDQARGAGESGGGGSGMGSSGSGVGRNGVGGSGKGGSGTGGSGAGGSATPAVSEAVDSGTAGKAAATGSGSAGPDPPPRPTGPSSSGLPSPFAAGPHTAPPAKPTLPSPFSSVPAPARPAKPTLPSPFGASPFATGGKPPDSGHEG